MLSVCVQDRIEAIAEQAQQFVDSGHFDSDNIKAKKTQLLTRYKDLKARLAHSLTVFSQ